MAKLMLVMAGIFGALGVAAGTFHAHGLDGYLEAQGNEDLAHAMDVFKTGVEYNMYHAVMLLGIAWMCDRFGGKMFAVAGWLIAAGIVLFPGSMYLIPLLGVKSLGLYAAPVGGLCLLGGWLAIPMGFIVSAGVGEEADG
ncbi:MAG: DUF423 domain-containing protein [Planctomycetota bacterium]|jgi:uncharacterized membrane protein YgdD (TMEM256/DUF423 family)